MPQLNRVLETALHADDLQRAASFYADVLGLGRLFVDARHRPSRSAAGACSWCHGAVRRFYSPR
jgi:hypothetical protein